VAGFCEHSNNPSGSIKGGGFLDYLSALLLASQEGLCSMQLVFLAHFMPSNKGDMLCELTGSMYGRSDVHPYVAKLGCLPFVITFVTAKVMIIW
jgi:hypothetical protein